MSGFVKVVLDISNTNPPKQPDIIKCKGVDYIRVVRCKDCKFYTTDIDSSGDAWNCCSEIGVFVGGDDYCSYGEEQEYE